MMPILEVKHLSKIFPLGKRGLFSEKKELYALKDVSFTLAENQTLGIVGESGSGKSTLARCIAGLYSDAEGEILFEGRDLLALSKEERKAEYENIQMIFQDPYSSLNPRMTAGENIGEPLRNLEPKEYSKERVLEMMELCGLEDYHYSRYPHEFSGGQRQRIGIARALILRPKLLLCDEPTSALDVSIQAQIINLLEELQKSLNLSYIFISHDLSVVHHIADCIGVMTKGELVEIGEKDQIFQDPKDDYTKTLLSAIPIQHPRDRR